MLESDNHEQLYWTVMNLSCIHQTTTVPCQFSQVYTSCL
uniref:Uncharacterized protein n=1 Tax=Arundo donax TaxID=35708 RepID=A0A0A9B2M1_ARUDO